jgi:glycosyltransferase involved in cell wall biosynthesis
VKFCMVTTFFGAHSFGGDATYVDRLSRALVRRGHQVEILHNIDAFDALRGDQPLRAYEAEAGMNVVGLRQPLPLLQLLWTHQTGQGGGAGKAVRQRLASATFDVVHFHNISLMGGLGMLEDCARDAAPIRLMSAHDFWLLCPLSLLWKHDREVCTQPSCTSCVLAAGRPPQLWRHTSLRDRALRGLDALLVPSEHTRQIHQAWGVTREIQTLPYFVPDQLLRQADEVVPLRNSTGRPYFAMAGRLIKEKGFGEAITQMRFLPQADLLIAGAGPYEDQLRLQAAGLENVRFTGMLDALSISSLFKGARAVIVPSLFYETFAYVVLEAFAAGAPVIVHNLGPLPDHVERSQGGLVYDSPAQLRDAMQTLLDGPAFARDLGARARVAATEHWRERAHMDRYFTLIERSRDRRVAVQPSA